MTKTLSSIVCSAMLTCTTLSASASGMPAELLGRYVAETGNCAQNQKSYKETGMWDGVTVEKGGVSFIESSCGAGRVTSSGAGAYNVVLKCSGEGEEWDVRANYKLTGTNLTITTKEGSERFKRCGK
ncbi:MAG: hypothetical protein ACOVLL_05845 [Hydrogenophaga sp.]